MQTSHDPGAVPGVGFNVNRQNANGPSCGKHDTELAQGGLVGEVGGGEGAGLVGGGAGAGFSAAGGGDGLLSTGAAPSGI